MTNIKHKIKNPETKIKLDFYHLPAHCGVGGWLALFWTIVVGPSAPLGLLA